MRVGAMERGVVAVLLTVLALIGGACSGGDEEKGSPRSGGVSSTSTTTSSTTTTMSDEEFNSITDELTSEVEAAGSDFCGVVEAASAEVPAQATTPAQVERAVRMQVMVMEALAATTPVDEENAEKLRRSAAELVEAGEAAGWSTDFLGSDAAAAVLGGEQFQSALGAYFARATAECGVGDPEADGAEADQAEGRQG